MRDFEQSIIINEKIKLEERFEFRTIFSEEAVQAASVERVCFPPNEACTEEMMKQGLASLAKAANVFDAPLAFVVCADGEKAWKRPLDGMSTVHVDASILTDHMMLAATDLGLGSVWICRFDPTVIREEFGLPETLVPVNILAVGHPAGELKSPDRHATERIPTSELVIHA